jgi:DNA-binding response OmpR family regulator
MVDSHRPGQPARAQIPADRGAPKPNTIDAHIARPQAELARSDARIETLRGSDSSLVAS